MNLECRVRKELSMACNITEPKHSGVVYLSGPISGHDYKTARYGWRKVVADSVEPGIKVLSPMRHEGHLSEIQGPISVEPGEHFFSGDRIIVEKDKLDIERCDIMLVNLIGANRVSIGTMVEIGIAMTLGKKIILVMEPNGNVHGNHPFITVPASLRLDNLDDAIFAINSLCSEGI